MATIKKISAGLTGFYLNLLAYINPEKLKRDGLNLFCTPFSRSLKPHHQAFLSTGLAEVLEIDGNRIQSYRWGTGSRKVLLVHGWESHSFRWKTYVNTLVENDFTVLALDAPAHGNSTGKIMNLVIYERVLAAFLSRHNDVDTIIAHSIGGFTTTYYLSRNPETSVQKAVILAAPGKVEEFFEFFVQFLRLRKKTIQLISDHFEAVLKQKPSYFSAVNFARDIRAKALIIHDRADKSTKYTDSEKLSRAWDGSTLKITQGLGHELKNEELLSEIIGFIK
jgi:pimeloyl-ACP methyl ester carboxylesterase